MGFLAKIWARFRGREPQRPITTVELLQRAERARREGRMVDASDYVDRAIEIDPRNSLAHLLSGYLHATERRTELARRAFQTVLTLDPDHPRALLGLARADLEAGDVSGCRDLLESALKTYPDFPEARALLEVVRGLAPLRGPTPALPSPELRLQQVALPPDTRECLLVDTDGTVLFVFPVSRTREALAAHLVRVSSMATAALARAGLGPMRRGAMGSNTGLTFVQGDSRLVLALTLPPTANTEESRRVVEALWIRCMEELNAGARHAGG